MILDLYPPCPYEGHVEIFFSTDQQEILDCVEELYNHTGRPTVDARGWVIESKKKGFVAIWVADLDDLEALGHECIHASMAILRSYGENPASAEETLCQVWEYLFRTIATYYSRED